MARSTPGRPPAVRSDPGIAARLAAIGLAHDWDFVFHLPLRYEDETAVVAIDELCDGTEAQVEATVTAAEVVFRGRRQLRVTVQDATGTFDRAAALAKFRKLHERAVSGGAMDVAHVFATNIERLERGVNDVQDLFPVEVEDRNPEDGVPPG